ncbi:MAG TPA: ferredoxin [Streptosporangiaceae bacterium]|nr:ferredoxin [Streptosporangiaceae bacterium]
MRVVTNLALCEGHSVCASLVPEVFDIGDADHVELLQEHPAEDLTERVRAAIARCPKQALSVAD